jgi:hypothetical protein
MSKQDSPITKIWNAACTVKGAFEHIKESSERGVCIHCGENPVDPPVKFCVDCRKLAANGAATGLAGVTKGVLQDLFEDLLTGTGTDEDDVR